MEPEGTPEERILKATGEVFLAKGIQGARMQEIADRAGINKEMLHYSFRSKEKLLDLILVPFVGSHFSTESGILNSNLPLLPKICAFVDNYLEVLAGEPRLPVVVLAAIHSNPGRCNQLLIKIVSLCLLPVMWGSTFQTLLRMTEDQYRDLLRARKEEVMRTVIDCLRP